MNKLLVFICILISSTDVLSLDNDSLIKTQNKIIVLGEDHRYPKQNDLICLAYLKQELALSSKCYILDEIPISAGYIINTYYKQKDFKSLKRYLRQVIDINLSKNLIKKINMLVDLKDSIEIKGLDIEYSYLNVFYFLNFICSKNEYFKKYDTYYYFYDDLNFYNRKAEVCSFIRKFKQTFENDSLIKMSNIIDKHEYEILLYSLTTFGLNIDESFMEDENYQSNYQKRDSAIAQIIQYHLKSINKNESIIIRIGDAHFNKELSKNLKTVKDFLDEKNITYYRYEIIYGSKNNPNCHFQKTLEFENKFFIECKDKINGNLYILKK